MRTLKILTVLLSVLTLLSVNIAVAEPTHNNEVGLYTNDDGTGATGTYVMETPVDVYLVLTRPTDVENGDAPYSFILAYELTLTFSPVPNNDLFLVGVLLPPENVDIGLRKDINEGFLDFTVGLASSASLPVTNESAVLVTLTFLNTNPGMTAISLGPPPRTSTPGEMDYIGENNPDIRVMYSMAGSHEAPAFLFNGEAVVVENASFGSVKALYR
jgi:hypothetical protein